jgi:hypothetical protein
MSAVHTNCNLVDASSRSVSRTHLVCTARTARACCSGGTLSWRFIGTLANMYVGGSSETLRPKKRLHERVRGVWLELMFLENARFVQIHDLPTLDGLGLKLRLPVLAVEVHEVRNDLFRRGADHSFHLTKQQASDRISSAPTRRSWMFLSTAPCQCPSRTCQREPEPRESKRPPPRCKAARPCASP